MDGQLSFATLDYAGKKKRTKRGYVEGQNVTISTVGRSGGTGFGCWGWLLSLWAQSIGVPFLEKWGGPLAVQPSWQRRTNVWHEVTSLAPGRQLQ